MKTILATNGQPILVDDTDHELLSFVNWNINQDGYARTNLKGRERVMHRSIMGKPPQGMSIHHKDGNKLNNQRVNLEFVPIGSHTHKHRGGHKASSKFRGVKPNGKWGFQATIGRNPRHCLGTFPTEEEAAKAYDKVAKELYGEHAVLNFPEL